MTKEVLQNTGAESVRATCNPHGARDCERAPGKERTGVKSLAVQQCRDHTASLVLFYRKYILKCRGRGTGTASNSHIDKD